MAESLRRSSSRKPPLRLVEGEKSKPSITIDFPGLEGTALPSVDRLGKELLPILGEEILEKLIKYFQGVLVALPKEQDRPKALLPIFKSRQWRKDQGFQRQCAQIGIIVPHSVKDIHDAWFRAIVKFTKVPGTTERKYHTQTIGERLRRRLSKNEKRMLLQVKEFIQVLIDLLLEEQQTQRAKEVDQKKADIGEQIKALVEQKRAKGALLVSSQKELFEERDRTEVHSSTRRQIDEKIQHNRKNILAALTDLDDQIALLQKKMKMPERKWKQRAELERQLNMVWEGMRLNGELEAE